MTQVGSLVLARICMRGIVPNIGAGIAHRPAVSWTLTRPVGRSRASLVDLPLTVRRRCGRGHASESTHSFGRGNNALPGDGRRRTLAYRLSVRV